MKLGLALLASTWAFMILAWFFPGFFKVLGAALYALGEAVESIRGTFGSRFKTHRAKGLQTAPVAETWEPKRELTPTQNDVMQALIAQGATQKRARVCIDRAITALPAQASFDDLWRKAVA